MVGGERMHVLEDRLRLDFLVWHETYHQGQMASYRRIAGRDGAI